VAGRDITEGDDNVWALAGDGLPIARGTADIGIVSTDAVWQNTNISYDTAIGGMPFISAISDKDEATRQTAPFRKDQFDNGTEPGEQSLTGWWLRSQMSFHSGAGINFFDPATNDEAGHYRFAESESIDVWTKGEAKLLKKTNIIGYPAAGLQSNGRSTHHTSSIKWTVSGTQYQGVLDGGDFNIVRITNTGAVQPLVGLTGTQDKIYAMTNDGEFVYYIVNEDATPKFHLYKKSLNAALGDASTLMVSNSQFVTNATLTYTKERLIGTVNNKIYEWSTSTSAMGSPVYEHPNTGHIWSSCASSGSAIYVAGWNGILSSIVKFVLNTNGTMPTLTSAITTAELPDGERIYALRYYLGHLMIGTLKGVRAASISESDGSVIYGPLIVETHQPVFGFASRQNYIWCASGTTTGKQGLIRIDLDNEISTLRFAYANDLQIATPIDGGQTVSVAFLGETDEIFFSNCSAVGRVTKSITNKQLTSNVATLTTSTAHGYMVGQAVYISGVGSPFDSTANFPVGSHKIITAVTETTFSYAVTNTDIASTAVSPVGTVFAAGTACIEAMSELEENGYIKTGNIRYGTLEPKNFKRLIGRGDFNYGSLGLITVDINGTEYDHITYDSQVPSVEVGTNQPSVAREYIAYKFLFTRDATTTSLGPIFKGYQAKATIATPRQRLIQFPVYCFDTETDRNGVTTGYKGRAHERILQLETIEESGDVVLWQDLNTQELRQVQIEAISLKRSTPPDKFSGYGGIITIVVRTV
jgi:hypothetical protein